MIKINLLRSIKISIAITLIVILIFIIHNTNNDLHMFFILTCIYIISVYISPFITYLEKGILSEKYNIFFVVNGILSGILIITSYFIFVSNNENIDIQIIIFIISFISIVLLQLVNEIKRFKINNLNNYKLSQKVNLTSITCVIWIVVMISLGVYFYEEDNTLYIRNLKIPNKILISNNRNANHDSHRTVIKNTNFIKNICNELEHKEINSIRNIERIKYLKKIKNKESYYVIPYYNPQNRAGLIDGYIDFIRIFKDGYCSIDEVSCKNGIQSYKIILSKDLVEDIKRVIKR